MGKTLYELHCERWARGCGAPICSGARNICLDGGRGSLPASVLFIGEAPGESEDSIGVCFSGPSGHMLDQIIKDALPSHVSYAITNLVGCIPREEVELDDGSKGYAGKAGEPDDEDIQQCSERLREFVALCNPKLLVGVGKLAGNYITPGYHHSTINDKRLPYICINHPAYILRQPFGHRSQMITRCIIQVRDAVEAYITNPRPKVERDTSAKVPGGSAVRPYYPEDDDIPF